MAAIAGPEAVREPDLVLVSAVSPLRPCFLMCQKGLFQQFPQGNNMIMNATLLNIKAKKTYDLHYMRAQVFGPVLTMAGYPPWPLRFSEIYHMGRLAGMTRQALRQALRRYCRTSQRFGT
jgi:hypothetical protein